MFLSKSDFQAKIFSFKYQSELPVMDFETRKARIEAFDTLVKGLTGSLSPAIYLASMDCGGGKSGLIIDFLKSWKSNDFKPQGSVLIALARIDEVERFATQSGLAKQDYAVFTASNQKNNNVNSYGLGRERAAEARVLFTTQQMVKSRMERAGSFEAVAELHYMGKPRPCRIWDESLTMAEGVVITIDTLRALPGKLRDRFPKAVEELDAFLTQMVMAGSGNEIEVPSTFASIFAPIMAAIGEYSLTEQEQEAIRSLVSLGGMSVGIENGVNRQLAIIGSGRPIPADFLPVTVFDASARVRYSYTLQEENLQNVVRLPTVVHDYRHMTFHLSKTAMGMDRLSNPTHRASILEATAKLINDDDEDYLIIHRLPKAGRFDIRAELGSLIPGRSRLSFVHWGSHFASNDYRHIKNVIVLGAWRKPEWVYGALAMASSGLGYNKIDIDQRRIIRLTENDHDLMQAVGRSNMRNVVDGIAGKVEVFAFMTADNDLESRLEAIFPGCRVEAWQPIEKAASGQIAGLISLLSSRLTAVGMKMKKADVRAALSISTAQGLSGLLRDDRIKRFLDLAGICVSRQSFEKQAISPA